MDFTMITIGDIAIAAIVTGGVLVMMLIGPPKDPPPERDAPPSQPVSDRDRLKEHYARKWGPE